jgi:hypothetical protein
MASVKLDLIHLQEIAKKQLEEERTQTFYLKCIASFLGLNLAVLLILIAR